MKRIFVIGLGLLLFTGCAEVDDKIEVSSNDPTEVSKILEEDRSETSVENYINRTYQQENTEIVDPQQPLNILLTSYSWYSDSYIFTFGTDQKIRASSFHGSKEQRDDTAYGSYEILNDESLNLHINGNYGVNVIQDYTYTVRREKDVLYLEDLTQEPQSKMTLYPVKKLPE